VPADAGAEADAGDDVVPGGLPAEESSDGSSTDGATEPPEHDTHAAEPPGDADDGDARDASGSDGAQKRNTPRPPQYTEYKVRAGDTMVSIAEAWFGDPNKWDLIAKANPLVDPTRMKIGQKLRLPPKDAQRRIEPPRREDDRIVYVVQGDDTLTAIARAYYNDPGLWHIIYKANRDAIGDNPNTLKVGMKLTIPPAPKEAEQS
jgi:nucleoid-associated protein YgaU